MGQRTTPMASSERLRLPATLLARLFAWSAIICLSKPTEPTCVCTRLCQAAIGVCLVFMEGAE